MISFEQNRLNKETGENRQLQTLVQFYNEMSRFWNHSESNRITSNRNQRNYWLRTREMEIKRKIELM